MTDPLPRLRALCLALPEVTEKISHGEPTWFVRRTFVSYADHHHDDRVAFWCAAPPGVQEELVAADPDRFFRPPYVGGRGWLGVWLDGPVDWTEIAELVTDAYRHVAPRRLVARLDAGATGGPALPAGATGGPALPAVEVLGRRFEYDDVPGDPALAPLLFLHEGLGSVGLWRGFHRRMAAATGRRAVAYSRLGHGFSDLPPAKRTTSFMHDEAAEVLPALTAALDLERPVLVGHSDGASIALLHAARADVAGLVVLAPHVFVEDHGLEGIASARRAYLEGDLRTRMTRHHRDVDVTFRGWNDVWLDPAFRRWDIRAELPGIGCPVLGVQGESDQYGSTAHVEAIRDAAAGPVDVLVLDCGHSPHLERPDDTERAVVEFLHRLPVSSPTSPASGPG